MLMARVLTMVKATGLESDSESESELELCMYCLLNVQTSGAVI